MIKANKELKKGMEEQVNVMVSDFQNVVKCLLQQKKWILYKTKCYFSVLAILIVLILR